MTATQARIDAIERIRREHIPDPDGDPAAPHCVTCSDASYPIWPCAAAWLLEQHDALVRREVERYRGVVVKQTGDGLMAASA